MKHLWKGYLLMNPRLKGNIEWGILAASGSIGLITALPRLINFPASLWIGAGMFLTGFIIHAISERIHTHAHERAKEIKTIMDTGIYGTIRHPLYLTLILMNFGIGIGFGYGLTIGLAALFSVMWLFTAREEEKFLIKSLNGEYDDYMNRVKWRMIPGIF